MSYGRMLMDFTFLICSALLISPCWCQTEFTVVQVNLLVRHGARREDKKIICDWSSAPLNKGALTANGFRMSYLLGVQLKKNYSRLFTGDRPEKLYSAYVSTSPRAIQTAASLLLGLFPPGTGQEITVDTDLDFVRPELDGITVTVQGKDALPFKYHPPAFISESNFNGRRFEIGSVKSSTCPGFLQYYRDTGVDYEKEFEREAESLTKELRSIGYDSRKLLQKDSFSIYDIFHISEEIDCYVSEFGSLPVGVSQEIREKIDRIAGVKSTSEVQGKLVKAKTDGIAREILNHMKSFAAGTGDSKSKLFIGHNSNILPFHLAFGLNSKECFVELARAGETRLPCRPLSRFAENLIWELNQKDGLFFVRVLANGEPLQLCEGPQDKVYCPLDEFAKYMEANTFYTDPDFEELCQNPFTWNGESSSVNSYNSWVTATVWIIILLVGVLALLITCHEHLVGRLVNREIHTPIELFPKPKLQYMQQ